MDGPFAITLMQCDGKHYIVLNKDRTIAAFRSVQEGLDSYLGMYRQNHARSYEASMSACVNFIFFRPAIVEFKNLPELVAALFDDTPHENRSVVRLSNVAGFFLGLKADDSKAEAVWNKAPKPALI